MSCWSHKLKETKHWKCVTTASQNFQGGGAWRLRHLLSSHKLQTLSFSSDRKFEQFLVRCEDLDLASRLLIDAGFAVGPTVRATSVSKGEGAWVESGPKLEDLQAVCSSPHLFRLEAEVSGRKIYVQVCSRLESGALVEASSAGELLKEAESITLATSSDSSDSSAHWTRLAERCTVVLELCDNPEKLVGYWLFASSGLFALILSPRSCAAARYEGPVGQAAQLELHSLSHAILGQVERPGLLKVLRSAWSEAKSQPCVFYDASSDAGTIEVDEEEKLLVQRHEDGSELRWHILRMDENPFAGAASDPCGACDGSDAEAKQNQDDIRSSPGRSRSRRRTMKSQEEEPTEVTKESVKEKKKVKKDKVPFKAEKEKKEKGERKDRREREDLERERERQKARERAREAERNDRAREREGREGWEGREGREKERESREKPKRHLERSHAFDKAGLPAGQPPVRTAAPANSVWCSQISQALPSQANASALLAAINQASQGHEHNPEVETFLSMNSVELHAATKLRGLPRHLQRQVLDRGSLMGARDPSAVLISRVRDAMMSSAMTTMPSMPILTMTLPNGQQVHPAVEALIIRYGLDAQCAQQLRLLPLQLQAVAAELPVHEARNPSAFVMAQLQLPRFKQAAKAMMQRT